jgi:hypothetical protein
MAIEKASICSLLADYIASKVVPDVWFQYNIEETEKPTDTL